MQKQELESYIKAGGIAKKVKTYAKEIIKPGMILLEIAEKIDNKIADLGATPAFPVNLSLNEVAAHFTPVPGDETVAEGILKVDLGVAVDGFIADTAFSVDLTEDKRFSAAARGIPSQKGTDVPSSSGMIELNEEILAEATKTVRAGMMVKDVGDAVQDTLEKWNEKNDTSFAVIKSLSGHALGKNTIHAGLTISNYRNDNKAVIDDMAFAIEPFVTTGAGDIYEGPVGGIYVLQKDGQVRDADARKVLSFVKENYKTRPFCRRWLEKEGFRKLGYVLSSLVKQGILHEYPLLIEKSKGPVSQCENTFVISDNRVVRTTE